MKAFWIPVTIFLSAICAACNPRDGSALIPGYLEADLIEIASPESGYLAELKVTRGATVEKETLLFRLEAPALANELIMTRQRRLEAEMRAEDSMRGEREETIRKLEANLTAQKADLDLMKKEYGRGPPPGGARGQASSRSPCFGEAAPTHEATGSMSERPTSPEPGVTGV